MAGVLTLGDSTIGATVSGIDDTVEGVSLAAGPRPLVRYPGKRPLIRVTTRPPHLETPFAVFDQGPITPNDAFFVRYHLADLPLALDPDAYRLSIGGHVSRPLQLSLSELRSIAEPVEVVAVNQCSGNSRGFFSPRVFGAQLGNGAMGNARWVGVPLADVLRKAGVKAGAKHVMFNGLDKPVLPSTSDFRKSLEIEHALSAEPLLAWQMNEAPLPFLNGFPLRLVVPGYFGTYWVKHLSEIEVLDHGFDGHDALFMTTAYRVPDNDCSCVAAGSAATTTRPITRLPVRSFITNVPPGSTLPSERKVELRGIAFDGGAGIQSVDVSIDAGLTWKAATLGEDLGRISFRPWRLNVRFGSNGDTILMARARNKVGDQQPALAEWNPAGYGRHVIESYPIHVS